MSPFWNVYVMVLVVVGVGLSAFLLLWGSSRHMHTDADGTTGHVWDDNLTESVRPVPRWWFLWSAGWLLIGIGYLVLYRGFGNYTGVLDTDQDKRFATQVAELDGQREKALSRFAAAPVAQLASDADAVALGGAVFAQHCAVCHGEHGRGASGFPNLTDGHWIWDSAPDGVLATVLDGRQAAMPPLGEVVGGEPGITATAVYVQSLAGGKVDPGLARAGGTHFKTICVACHGADGRGNPQLGAPDLTTGVYTYGGTFEALRTTIRDGRQGKMPAHRALLSEAEAKLVSAWVIAQGRADRTAGAH